jgi:hypothetical protein
VTVTISAFRNAKSCNVTEIYRLSEKPVASVVRVQRSCSVVSDKFTNISEEYITVVFRVPALYLRGCDVVNPEIVLPTFGGIFCLFLQDTGLLISAMLRRII